MHYLWASIIVLGMTAVSTAAPLPQSKPSAKHKKASKKNDKNIKTSSKDKKNKASLPLTNDANLPASINPKVLAALKGGYFSNDQKKLLPNQYLDKKETQTTIPQPTSPLIANQNSETDSTKSNTPSSTSTDPKQNLPLLPASVAPPPTSFVDLNKIQLKWQQLKDGFQLILSLNKPISLAVFSADNYVWIISDEPGKHLSSDIPKEYQNEIKGFLNISSEKQMILGIYPTSKEYRHPKIEKKGMKWILSFSKKNHIPVKNISYPTPKQQNTVIITMDDPKGPIKFIHDVKEFYVFPTQNLIGNTTFLKEFTPFYFLPSMQGAAIEVLSSSLSISLQKNSIAIQAPFKFLSTQNSNMMQRTPFSLPPFFFPMDEHQLKESSYPINKNVCSQNFFKRAWIALEKGQGTESIATLGLSTPDPCYGVSYDPRFQFMSSLANIVEARPNEQTIQALGLQKNEMQLWQSLSDLLNGKNLPQNIIASLPILNFYPVHLRKKLARLLLIKAVEEDKDTTAKVLLDGIELPADQFTREWKIFINARLKRHSSPHEAAFILNKLSKTTPSLFLQVLSKFSALQIQDKNAEISKETYLKELKNLSYAWKDGILQYDIIKALINGYEETKNYPEVIHGIAFLRLHLPTYYQQDQWDAKLSQALVSYFKEPNINPINGLAIYRQYQNDIPKKNKADVFDSAFKLVKKLDLINQAALMIESRLKDENMPDPDIWRYRLGKIYFRLNKPQLAYDTLNKVEAPALQTKALQYKVRSLMALQKYQEAIDLLGTNDDVFALQLKKQIYFTFKKWIDYENVINRLLTKKDVDKDKLYLDLAVSYLIQNKPTNELRAKYLEAFKDPKKRAEFEMLTRPELTEPSDFNKYTIDNYVQSMKKEIGELQQILPSSKR